MTEHLAGIPRLRAAVLEAIDHPAAVVLPQEGQLAEESDVQFACRVAMYVLIAIAAEEREKQKLANWKPTGFLNTPATITSEDS